MAPEIEAAIIGLATQRADLGAGRIAAELQGRGVRASTLARIDPGVLTKTDPPTIAPSAWA
jgi:hypothetical protein